MNNLISLFSSHFSVFTSQFSVLASRRFLRTLSLFSFHFSVLSSRRSLRSNSGQAIVEYAIVFPILLLITLGIIQLSQIFVAKQVLEYAAFCGARAAVVGYDSVESRRAALIPISRIAGMGATSEPARISIPGWGVLGKSGAAEEKTSMVVGPGPWSQNSVQCEIEHRYELTVPIGNRIAYAIGDVALGMDNMVMIGDVPHMKIKAKCILAQPWTATQ